MTTHDAYLARHETGLSFGGPEHDELDSACPCLICTDEHGPALGCDWCGNACRDPLPSPSRDPIDVNDRICADCHHIEMSIVHTEALHQNVLMDFKYSSGEWQAGIEKVRANIAEMDRLLGKDEP